MSIYCTCDAKDHVFLFWQFKNPVVTHHNWSLLATSALTGMCIYIYIYIRVYIHMNIAGIRAHIMYASDRRKPPKPSNTIRKRSTGVKTQQHPVQLPSTGLKI